MEDYYSTEDVDEQYDHLDLKLKDDQLVQMVGKALEESRDFWNDAPYYLDKADKDNVEYWLGNQMPEYEGVRNMGNRLQTSSRAVLAYINSRVANPEVAPSTDRQDARQFAKDIGAALKQHSVDRSLAQKAKKSTTNLVIQKRGFLKLRFDPLIGAFGDIEVEHVSPESITIDKDAVFGREPSRIWHKQECTLEELAMKFPDKESQIKEAFGIGRGVYSQMSRRATYYECWFTYYADNKRQEGLCWYLPKGKIILGKMQNPNYIYTGDDKQDRLINFMPFPIKPFIPFNYMNTGKGFLDETSLFEQAKPLQDLYNKRRRQIMESNDYMNGRIITAGIKDDDAVKLFSKNPQAILNLGVAEGKTVRDVVYHVPHNPLPVQSTEEGYDYRNEIDQVMGTPNIFRGEQSKNNTLGQDERLIQQAGALQDDLAAAVDEAMQLYYRYLFHMMKVYYTEDHWFQIRGDDGKFDFVVMNGDTMDTNIKISVEAGSTLPANKQEIRQVAIDAANAQKIDDLSFWEAMVYGKLPDPETIVERTQKQLNDPQAFFSDVEQQGFDREAQTDITMLIADAEPPERDDYGQAYLEYLNNFVMGNKFLQLETDAQERIKVHLASAGMVAARRANLEPTQAAPVDPLQAAAEEVQAMLEEQAAQEQAAEPPPPEQSLMPQPVAPTL